MSNTEINTNTVLIFTSSIDETVSYIINRHSNLADLFRIDIDKFNDYEFSITDIGWSISDGIRTETDKTIKSIYYRKPMLPNISTFEPQYHRMIQRDIISVINGIADSFPCKVLTKPSLLRKTENKIYQLMYAARHGFQIPQSYIGNKNDATEEYRESNAIIKPLTTGKTCGENGWELYQTSLFHGVEEDISLTPVYLQKYILKQYEVRLTIINGQIYPVRIDTISKLDWRADYENHKYTLIDCPGEIKQKCLKMMNDFHLSFGAFDFIVTPDNEWVFLEVNPNGQWLWLEKCLNLDISDQIVRWLVE